MVVLEKPDSARAFPLVLFVLLLTGVPSGYGEEKAFWSVLDLGVQHSSVVIRTPGTASFDPQASVFVVTHGMGGTSDADRFHQLAEAIWLAQPDSFVFLLDWSEASKAEFALVKLPDPWTVAGRIDRVAIEAAELLRRLGVDPKRMTLIGESFGNWVNAEIADQLGGVDRILAMNPASEFGGYDPPDLSQRARLALAFHTYSILDTLKRVSHYSILLEAPEGTYADQWHTLGIRRLAQWIETGETKWICGSIQLNASDRDRFDAISTVDGRLLETKLKMQPPQPAQSLAPDGRGKDVKAVAPPQKMIRKEMSACSSVLISVQEN